MIQTIRAAQRHSEDFGWLKTHWLFSFSDYYDPNNLQFGALRVYNDDIVEPGMGFPSHSHHEMEILTVVLEGEITHEDSTGNRTVIRAGDVQRMSAGTGITHSEFNLAHTPVHFHQIWIHPDQRGLPASYDQRTFLPGSWKNRLCPLASGQGLPKAVAFGTDATVYRSELDAGNSAVFETSEDRRIFVYIISGSLSLNRQRMAAGDQARIDLETELTFSTPKAADFLMLDVPSCRGWGYDRKTLRGAKGIPARPAS